MRHLQIKPRDSQDTVSLKSSVQNQRTIMEVLVLVKEAKELVTYLKSTGLAASLTKKVLQECETRWNSLHTMLNSVEEMYDEIAALLGDKPGQQNRMRKIDRDMLSALRDHCEPSFDDCTHLTLLKERCQRFLDMKFKPSIKAKVATFLWPDYKDLTMLPDDEKQEVVAKVRQIIGAVEPDADDVVPGEAATPTLRPPKVPRLDKYLKYKKQPLHQPPQDEVEKYLAMAVTVAPDQLLKWWNMMNRPDGLPKLAKLAKRELCKLATAAPSDRIWSKTGFILNNRRNRLSPKHLNAIVFMGSALRAECKKRKD
ncbi:E3 SUMO-protein ligase ZBED1 [Frankliniella fusca]|uniref:E3 SUMO-protein ligase ZBED1 n=1 Tax=Frankliniella fusca TaxID=407009 RepID=A0AAE1HZ57_9NEOP|nr:E3 SUMO-protein ligase ZBED1 [Frankliniella fusca]